MARMGRPPMPNEEHRRRGNPSRKSLPAPATVTTLGKAPESPPDGLGDAGVALWSWVVVHSPWVAASDVPTLWETCRLLDIRERIESGFAFDGDTVDGASGSLKPHPMWPTWVAVTKQIGVGLATLGLNPADRSRLGLGEIRAKTKLQELMEMEQRDRIARGG